MINFYLFLIYFIRLYIYMKIVFNFSLNPDLIKAKSNLKDITEYPNIFYYQLIF